METWRPWLYPTPLCTTGRLEKRPVSGGVHTEREIEVRKMEGVEEANQRKEVVNESQKDEEEEERGEPKCERE